MKPLLYFILLLPSLVYAQAKTAQELMTANLKKYEIKSGEISYTVSGDADGQEQMIFDKYGWSATRKQTMNFELYGISSTQNLYEITNGDFVYRLNTKDSTYTTKKDMKWSQQASYKSPAQVSESILFSMGGSHESDATLLNKNCQVWTFEGKALMELWVWKGLVLKRKVKLGDRLVITTASAIKLDISPEKELFTIPDFFQIKK